MNALYQRFREAGYTAKHALIAAKSKEAFDELEAQGLVRLRAEPEQENYFDIYGEPEGYENRYGKRVSAEQERKELCESIDRYGCWYLVAEYRASEDDDWKHSDSIGMNTGYANVLSPFENWYVPGLMSSAVAAVENSAVCPAI